MVFSRCRAPIPTYILIPTHTHSTHTHTKSALAKGNTHHLTTVYSLSDVKFGHVFDFSLVK